MSRPDILKVWGDSLQAKEEAERLAMMSRCHQCGLPIEGTAVGRLVNGTVQHSHPPCYVSQRAAPFPSAPAVRTSTP